MPRLIELTPNKTYASRKNAICAVERVFPMNRLENVRYFIATHTDGRFFPVFIGQDAACNGVHFHFNVVA